MTRNLFVPIVSAPCLNFKLHLPVEMSRSDADMSIIRIKEKIHHNNLLMKSVDNTMEAWLKSNPSPVYGSFYYPDVDQWQRAFDKWAQSKDVQYQNYKEFFDVNHELSIFSLAHTIEYDVIEVPLKNGYSIVKKIGQVQYEI